MSSITYTWKPSCTPIYHLPDFTEQEALHRSHLEKGDYAAIIQSKDLFWIGARKIIDLNDPYQKQRQYGFSLQNPVERIRQLFEKNLTEQSDFSIAILGNDTHIHVKEDAPQIKVDTHSDYTYHESSDWEAPRQVTTDLCPSKEQVLLKDFLPDFIAECGATCAIRREFRDVNFGNSSITLYVRQKVDIVHVTWNKD